MVGTLTQLFPPAAGDFFWFLLFMDLTCLYFTFYGTMAVAITPNLMTSAVLSSFFYGIWCVAHAALASHARPVHSRPHLLCGVLLPIHYLTILRSTHAHLRV